ncbi:MAG: glycosyltransferase family 2 protein [Bacteroidia bacterium]|nr:glycosyltransferase family 2 protein [Bacteroidia bacterium]
MVKVAVVILNWNGKIFLKKFLPFLIRYSSDSDVELYIADNGSKDDSIPFLKASYPQIKLLLFDKNYGFSEGYNKALFRIDAKYFILLNSDVEVTQDWINPIIRLMDNDPLIAACMPKIKGYDQKEYFEYAGAAGGFIDTFGFPFCRGRILNVIEKDEGQYNETTEVFWASGACMFVRADLYKSSGGLDNDFFAHMEEIDLCWRMKNMGYKIMYCPDVSIYHVGGGTLPNNSPHKLYLNFRNNLLLLYKNLPQEKFHSVLFKRKLFDGVAALKYLASFSFKEFNAVYKAHKAYNSMLKNFRLKRSELQKSVIKTMHPQILSKSIIILFFLKKKQKFTELEF